MNIEKYLKDLYKTDKIKVQLTDLGLSNDIYYIEINNQKYALRHISNKATIDNINLERKIQLIAKDIDFEEVYYDRINHIRITKWIDDLKTFSNYFGKEKYIKTIENIKYFHELNIKTKTNFNLKNKYYFFIQNIKNKLFDYNQYESILEKYTTLKMPIVLSHNDLVDGNICFKNDKCYLIDYEYASNNYEYFDLISLLSENKIYNENLRKEIFNLYFNNKTNDETIYNCLIIEMSQDLLWSAWANYEYNIKNKDIYYEIFTDKTNRLKQLSAKL